MTRIGKIERNNEMVARAKETVDATALVDLLKCKYRNHANKCIAFSRPCGGPQSSNKSRRKYKAAHPSVHLRAQHLKSNGPRVRVGVPVWCLPVQYRKFQL